MIALEQTGDALVTGGMKCHLLRIVAARLALELLRCKMGISCLLYMSRHAELVSASIAPIRFAFAVRWTLKQVQDDGNIGRNEYGPNDQYENV